MPSQVVMYNNHANNLVLKAFNDLLLEILKTIARRSLRRSVLIATKCSAVLNCRDEQQVKLDEPILRI